MRKPFLELSLEEYEAGYESNGYVISVPFDRSEILHRSDGDHNRAHKSFEDTNCYE